MTNSKTHFYGHSTHGMNVLFCSGRAVEFAFTSAILDEVTCGACRRKIVAQSKKVGA